MATWVRPDDIEKRPEVYGGADIFKIKIDYQPNKRNIIFPADLTGYEKDQSMSTEDIESWYLTKYQGMWYIISGSVTKKYFWLKGRKGAGNAHIILTSVASLYESEEISTQALTWNYKTLKILNTVPDFIRHVPGVYWTEMIVQDKESFGLKVMDIFGGHLSKMYDTSDSSKPECAMTYGIFPLLMVKTGILVDADYIGKGKLPIKRA